MVKNKSFDQIVNEIKQALEKAAKDSDINVQIYEDERSLTYRATPGSELKAAAAALVPGPPKWGDRRWETKAYSRHNLFNDMKNDGMDEAAILILFHTQSQEVQGLIDIWAAKLSLQILDGNLPAWAGANKIIFVEG
jgi:hypothetical protein